MTNESERMAVHNQRLIDQTRGIPAKPGTPETDADPRNPNAQPPPAELGLETTEEERKIWAAPGPGGDGKYGKFSRDIDRLVAEVARLNLIIRDVAELRGILRQHVAPPPPAELGLETTEASLAMIRWASEHPDDPRDWSMFHRMVRKLLDDYDRLSAEVARLTNRYESMDEHDERPYG